MSEWLRRLSAEKLLDECPIKIISGNWNEAWQEVRYRVRRLESQKRALQEMTGDGICACWMCKKLRDLIEAEP